jgi:hypothetical protein
VGDRTPVEVGQVREDPRRQRRVRVAAVYGGMCAEIVNVATGRRTITELDRLERWRVVEVPDAG